MFVASVPTRSSAFFLAGTYGNYLSSDRVYSTSRAISGFPILVSSYLAYYAIRYQVYDREHGVYRSRATPLYAL